MCTALPKERCFCKGQWLRRRHTVPTSAFVKSPLPQGLPDLHQWSLEDVSLTGRFPQMSLEGDSAGSSSASRQVQSCRELLLWLLVLGMGCLSVYICSELESSSLGHWICHRPWGELVFL